MSEFNHGLSPEFIRRLAEEAKKVSWWADVLNDPDLFVAVREEYLNVYWRGHSLFRVELAASGLRVTTHVKFLVDPKLAHQVSLAEGKFVVSELADRGFISQYEGEGTLAKMKTAADLFSEPEKTGCHEIILTNPQVIDCEIAFPGSGGPDKGAPRVDLLSLEPDGGLVFWEAKHFTNGDLRAPDQEDVPVCKQINCYRQYLSQPKRRDAIEKSYKRVVENLLAIDKMRREPRRLSRLITEVPDRRQQPTLGAEPKVGLVIFGFDKAQRDDPNWKKHHLERLEKDGKVARVVAAGDAKHIRLKP